MIHSRALLGAAAILSLLLTACFSGQKKPLFGGDDPSDAPQLGASVATPTDPGSAALPLRTSTVDQLLTRLRKAGVGPTKRAILKELLARKEAAKPEVRRALDEERVVLDMLKELARRLDVPPRPSRAGRVKARWVQAKYQLALDRYTAGDLYGALRVIDAVFALEPDTVLGTKLRRLRRRCTDRLMRDGLLRAEIVYSTKACLETKAPLAVTIRITNVSRERIEIKVSEKRKLALGVVNLDYEELSHLGTRTRLRTQHRVSAPSTKLVLGPGQALTLELDLPSPHRKLTQGLVGRYQVGGWLRAQSMRVGTTDYPGFIPLLSRTHLALGPADHPLSETPQARFKEFVAAAQKGTHAARREPARRAFVTAVVWAQAHREAALAGLIEALNVATRPPLSDSLCAALGRISGEPLSFTRHEWLMWWTERESRPRRVEQND